MANAPILEVLTLLAMGVVAFFHWRIGLFAAFLTLINFLLAGLLAFNFWEPLTRTAAAVSPSLDAYADALALVTLFALFMSLLRWATFRLGRPGVEFTPFVDRVGGGLSGLVLGWVASGFLICVLQTLPWSVHFLGYDPVDGMGLGAPDRGWLAFVHRASGRVFDLSSYGDHWFDADGSFIPRYARYRRIAEGKEQPERNRGEFPPIVQTSKPYRR